MIKYFSLSEIYIVLNLQLILLSCGVTTKMFPSFSDVRSRTAIYSQCVNFISNSHTMT